MPVNYTNTSVDVLASSFQVLEELGSGSFGVVYKAIEKESGTIVAIKHIDLESSEDDIREIQQEISVLSSCASPFVTQYYGSFVRGFKLWIIMEYLAGGSCLDLLKPAPFCEAHIAIVMRELLQGLEYLHREGKIHRDIKAANILLSGTGQVKLADFGVATQLNNIKSQRNTFVGTPFWMAPEVISQENPYSFKADIWSLGITAMELCHGEPPHSTIHPMKVLFLIPKEPAPRLEGNRWSRDFKDFVERCLVKDPNQRASARELLNHRFIKNAGRVEELQSLIERRESWQMKREARGVTKSHPRLYEETMNTFGGQPEESWDFDTIRTNPHSGTIRIDHHRNAMRASEIVSERSMNSALQKLNLNAAPQSGVSVTEARKVSESAAKAHNQKRRRSSTAKKPAEKTVLESTTPTRTNQKPARQERPMTAETDYGKTPSTVRQFKRVPENTPRNYEAVHHQEKELKLEIEKPVMNIPTTEEGQLGRKLFSKVVQKTLLEVENKAIKNGNSATASATSNLAEAWSQLDAIDPESGYELLRAMMDRFQQHQPKPQPEAQAQNQPIRQLASSRPFQKSPAAEAAAKMITPKPSLSSETLTAASSSPPPEPTPKVITRTKRASSNVANKKKRRGSRQSSDFGDEVDDSYLGSTPAGNQLADVLYGRWVEGLKGRWGAVAK